MLKEVFIVSALRTPIGSFNGRLSSLSATELAGKAAAACMKESGLSPSAIEELFLGNVLSAGLGQAPATQVARFAGLNRVPASTINKVCASGMKAVMLAAQGIRLGESDLIMAGGTESMSNVPYYLPNARQGYKLGHQQVVDGLIRDGLWDIYQDYHMGSAAELCARHYGISREEQDRYALQSYERAAYASGQGCFKREIVPVETEGRKGEVQQVEEDEEFRQLKKEKVGQLKPVFEKDGTVTAANASTLNDGAAMLVLASESKVKEFGLRPLARILSYADAQHDPEWFTTAPASAIPKALELAALKSEQIDLFEINEAFSVVSLANKQILNLDEERLNVCGGAVALGHPLGASGARILVTLIHSLIREQKKMGLAAICNGGGGASAIVVEALQ